MTTEAEALLHEAEEQIEAWLCELDGTWCALLDDARAEAERLVTRARAESTELIAEARDDAMRLLANAGDEAERLRQEAHDDAQALLASTGRTVERRLAEAEEEFERLRMIATEHADALRALAAADAAAARGAVREDLTGIREAVTQLRLELSRVVDAAFDALPAVEATAGALDRVMNDGETTSHDDTVIDLEDSRDIIDVTDAATIGDMDADDESTRGPRRGRLRRLLRIGR